MRGLFFTGTDTGVGKTFVVAAVAKLLLTQGRNPRVSKPVATGSSTVAEDTLLLARAIGATRPEDLRAITPWHFPEPAAPPVAARAVGVTLTLENLTRAVRDSAYEAEILLVEGVGGLLCPLTDRQTVADLVCELGYPLVIVARRSLGTLNHTLMTVEAALGRHLPVAGVVVSETMPPEGLAAETNVEELRRRLPVPLLAVIPHGSDERVLGGVDWWQLGTR